MNIQQQLTSLRELFMLFEDPKDKFVQLMDMAKESEHLKENDKIEKNKFLLRNFSGVSFKSFNTKDIRKLKTNTTYKYDEKLQEIRINNILEDPLINNCITNKKNFSSNYLKSFSCMPKGIKLICGYK